MKTSHYSKVALFFLCFTSLIIASEKVLIITHAYNRPDFIEIQHKTLKALLEDDYEFVVFNDAPTDVLCKNIENTCAQLGIRCVRIPQHMHKEQTANWRHADGIRYSLEIAGFNHDGYLFLIDSDMFLIKKFNIKKYLDGYDIAGCPQGRDNHKMQVRYIWPGIVFMNMNTMPNKRTMNWNCGRVEGEPVDVGGLLHYYLKENPQLKIKYFGPTYVEDLPKDFSALKERGFDDNTINNLITKNPHWMEFYVEGHFLHYRGGMNWANQSAEYHAEKTRILNTFIHSLLNAQ